MARKWKLKEVELAGDCGENAALIVQLIRRHTTRKWKLDSFKNYGGKFMHLYFRNRSFRKKKGK